MGRELARAALEANAKVAQALFTMATQDKNVVATIFWMKARALSRDRRERGPAQVADEWPRYVIRAVPKLSTEEWLAAYAPAYVRNRA